MNDTSAMLAEMTERLLLKAFDDGAMRSAREGIWPQNTWDSAVQQGLHLALVEGEQGFGIPLEAGLPLIRLLGRQAVALPLAETMIANALLAHAGLPTVEGAVALVPDGAHISLREKGASWSATGEPSRIAWGRNVDALLVQDGDHIGLVQSGFHAVEYGANLAQMPRDRMVVDGNATVAQLPGIAVLDAGALVRALAMAGAMETLVELTVAHVSYRNQFGRPLCAFQTVQHLLARLAGEAVAASAAADLAAEAFSASSPRTSFAIAAARTRISEAAGTAIGIAHQLHGAIGFTNEHRLHWFTTALWSWRDEFGSAALWSRRLGVEALARSGPSYWPLITSV